MGQGGVRCGKSDSKQKSWPRSCSSTGASATAAKRSKSSMYRGGTYATHTLTPEHPNNGLLDPKLVRHTSAH